MYVHVFKDEINSEKETAHLIGSKLNLELIKLYLLYLIQFEAWL